MCCANEIHNLSRGEQANRYTTNADVVVLCCTSEKKPNSRSYFHTPGHLLENIVRRHIASTIKIQLSVLV
jgi:hypothetical protein